MLGLRINVGRPVAEIFIIVAGVLIALGVDSWNDNRTDRSLEAQYLERLAEDVRYNAARLRGIPDSFGQKLARLQQIAETADQPIEDQTKLISEVDTFSWATQYGWAIPELRMGTFEELKSTGNLGLIRDLDLRTALNEYDLQVRNALERTEARMTDYPNYVYTLYPGVVGNLPVNLNAEATEEILNEIRTPEFRRLLNAEQNYAAFARGVMEEVLTGSETLLETLEEALVE